MKAKLKQEVENTFAALYQTISLFDQSKINIIPFEGSWTPGQVVRHIIKATSGFKKVCDGNTKKLENAIDEKIPVLKDIFLNFNTKYDSPDFIYPEDREYDKIELTSRLQKIESEILDIVANYDLSLTCLDFEIPGIGTLTIYELINFAIFHTTRHTHQLKVIFEK
ncbi:DinB family protein [Flavobacterium psychroterrae]|uniref:DinB family protein n=1 Tax=Flavobacterium psychroterrae TaxID=2133767 RepID=A0ABS5PGW9_9FLAO|nr:DinB family protein [Flavobacterium psychroterrae]MBS7233553.1 DinB family protein [Flavobacterium psychroterrae]